MIMAPNSTQLLLLFLLAFLLFTQITHPRHYHCMGDDSTNTNRCLETERKALVQFKGGLHDPTGNRLSSWVGEDCCAWRGVRCHNRTGHVVHLDLRNPHPHLDFTDGFELDDSTHCFSGEISPSLLSLTHLKYLDLSMNCFNSTHIPKFIGSLKELRYLNLSGAGFGGVVPHELGNLSNLHHLDLSWASYDISDGFEMSGLELHVDSLRWLSGLGSLQHLDMSFVDLSMASSTWVQQLSALPSLHVIRLGNCLLDKIPLSLLHNNLTSLSVLDLANNFFNSTIPNWLFNMTGLQQLNLERNSFFGPFPVTIGKAFPSLKVLGLSYNYDVKLGNISETLGNLCELQKLSLSGINIKQELTEFVAILLRCMSDNLQSLEMTETGLTGIIPESLGRLSSLQKLLLGGNELNGTIPESLWQLSELIYLELGINSLMGVLSEVHFSGLAKLEFLGLSNNPLALKVGPDWVPPFQLKYIEMSSCALGPEFPAWLKTQVNLVFISLSNAGIMDTIPSWFWNLTSKIVFLNLSLNKIRGKLPQSLIFARSQGEPISVNLRCNLFDGPLPQQILSNNGLTLDLSNNSLSGSLPPSIEDSWPRLNELSLSMNNITGSIPSSFCKMKDLTIFDISSNQLSGEVPDCWSKSNSLGIIDFSNNNLFGGIPKSFGSLPGLLRLHLRNNSLTGELPISLESCVSMYVLDLGHNKFMGYIPGWIGKSLSNLLILLLDFNMFDGSIPPQLSLLTRLHILDLSSNNLSGPIPATFGNFSAMRDISPLDTLQDIIPYTSAYTEDVLVIMKANELEYKDEGVISLLRIIDLSNNGLSGSIPEEVANLSKLQSLNLSRNLLTGQITDKIGGLRQLLSLDLSRNMLSGSIPPNLSALTFLEALDLSYNNLSGRIPQGNQLQTFIDPSIYAGNDGLCGFPLAKKCQDDASQGTSRIMPSGNINADDDDQSWLYAGMGPGFAVGFSIVNGLLLVKEAWRHAYFQLFDTIYDKLYVVVVVNVARLQHKLQGYTPNL